MLCRSNIATCFVQVINTQSVNWVSGSVFIAVVVVKKKKKEKKWSKANRALTS